MPGAGRCQSKKLMGGIKEIYPGGTILEASLTWLNAGSLDQPDVICLMRISCPERKSGTTPLA